MHINFPDDFIFGTSTSACQIETAIEHDWTNVKSKDGHIFNRTTDHEKRIAEDIKIIASLAPHYRMSLMWSKLQRAPYARLETDAVKEYTHLLQELNERGVRIMLVIHHFANPRWFSDSGGWTNRENINVWLDFAKKLVDTFARFVHLWNTFNEPNLYISMAFLKGEFPPYTKNFLKANRSLRNMADAHNLIYEFIKSRDGNSSVGISHNCTVFEADNWQGILPAKLIDWWYMSYVGDKFKKIDFFGMSYYARIGFDPLPATFLTTPEKILKSGKQHDDMWEYYPKGLEACIMRFWKRYQKPIIITENGICTQDDTLRIKAINDYITSVSNAIRRGADVRGYYHWSAWDNFEWSLGPTFQFGLYECDLLTKERRKKPSADVYARLAFSRKLEV